MLALLATAVSVVRKLPFAVCARRDELSYYAAKFKIKLLCRFVITPFSKKIPRFFSRRRSSENLQSCYFSDLAPMIKMHFCYRYRVTISGYKTSQKSVDFCEEGVAMKRNCKAKFFALLNSSICHDVRQQIDLSLLRRWLLRRAVLIKPIVL